MSSTPRYDIYGRPLPVPWSELPLGEKIMVIIILIIILLVFFYVISQKYSYGFKEGEIVHCPYNKTTYIISGGTKRYIDYNRYVAMGQPYTRVLNSGECNYLATIPNGQAY